ncbi:patatin-like phospholipase family protein [Aurantimonas sp. VKM B-3413]|uniref:patatin-like phospholipase family protein n=1 Tax=Aurantimonas sp. VKM B-3413 TaxID=2779401 RepID=UPI001E5CBCDE|nr:patatin-like phospholipase family protein [Aurantimonas sp. VKM B-3413]MCB8836960.1 patatin-like phospholipase family protein [Aurantimonas sp. VKM B-3413]
MRIGLALGGGGARGIAHIQVLEAMDELGVRPDRIVGSSIGAIVGAGFAAGMQGHDIRAYMVDCFASKRLVLGRLWQTRPANFQDFFAEGGFRLGQLNAKRVVAAFLPHEVPITFEALKIPLGVMATDFYGRVECRIETGDIRSALAASAALPALFRPVRRDGQVLIDGGIFNPLPFDKLAGEVDRIVAIDVNGGPERDGDRLPTPLEAMMGASQLTMQAIIESKLKMSPPDILLRPPVSPYGVLDFLRIREILEETASFKEEAKQAIGRMIEAESHPQTGAETGLPVFRGNTKSQEPAD